MFVKIYTDESKISARAGCGIYMTDTNLRYSITINKFSSSIISELFAILHALCLACLLKSSRSLLSQCCDRKSRATCAQSFAPWQQVTIEITRRDHSIIACSRHIHNGVILHAHPVRGESHNQRNTTGEVATTDSLCSLQSMTNWNWKKHSFTNKIALLCSALSASGCEVRFLWVPSHQNIPGN